MEIYQKSKKLLLENIKNNANINKDINWKDIITDDSQSQFYSSIINQIEFFDSLEFFTIHEIYSAFGISHKTYYKLYNKDEPFPPVIINVDESGF